MHSKHIATDALIAVFFFIDELMMCWILSVTEGNQNIFSYDLKKELEEVKFSL